MRKLPRLPKGTPTIRAQLYHVLLKRLRFAAASFFAFSGPVAPSRCQELHQHPAPEKLREVSFPVSCVPEVRKPFNQAVALLHSFAYAAAESKFLEIAETDPKCAMAHWGVAMSYYHQLWEPRIPPADVKRGEEEIQKARQTGGESSLEQGFIDGLAKKLEERKQTLYRRLE